MCLSAFMHVGILTPTTVPKETYYSVKRDLLQCPKRPTTSSTPPLLYPLPPFPPQVGQY